MTSELKTLRKGSLTDLSRVSEAELHQTDSSAKQQWQVMQDIIGRVNAEKIKALADIDAKYKVELEEATSQYAFLVTLTR